MLLYDLEHKMAALHVREAEERVERQKGLMESFVPGSEEQRKASRVLDIMRVVLAELKDFAEFVDSHDSAVRRPAESGLGGPTCTSSAEEANVARPSSGGSQIG